MGEGEGEGWWGGGGTCAFFSMGEKSEAGVKPFELRSSVPPLRSTGLLDVSSISSSISSRTAAPGRDDGIAGAAELARSGRLLADGCNVGDGGGSGLVAAAAALALATALAMAAGRAASTCSSIWRP